MFFLMSFFGPVYFGFKGFSYLWWIPIWSLYSSGMWMWQHRRDIKEARAENFRQGGDWTWFLWGKLTDLFLVFSITCAFAALHSAVYFAVRAFVK